MINIPNNIRQLCEKDTCRKNFRVHFVNGEHDDLTNENIVTESVSLTESICSGELQFGMCESSILSFDCDLSENFKGSEILAQIEIDISSESAAFIEEYGQTSDDVDFPFYPIFYGDFIVKDCKKAKNGLRHVEAYTQLLGDDKVTSTGTVSFVEYGLSNFEIAKMGYPSNNVPYEFDFLKFLVNNLQNYDTNQFAMDESIPLVVTDDEGVIIKSNTKKQYLFSFLINTEGVNTDVSDMNLYYYDFSNFENFYPITFDEFRDEVMSTAEPLISGETFSESEISILNEKLSELYNKYFNRKAGGIKNEIFRKDGRYSKPVVDGIDSDDESTYDSFYALKGYLYPYINTGVSGSVRFGACTGIQVQVSPVSGGGVYFRDIKATMSPIVKKCNTGLSARLSFPRSKSQKFGKTQQYALDYINLFNEGVTVTKKDKSGNTVTTTYKFSFRDMVEAYAEINALFGMYWRRSRSFSFDGLTFPDKSKTVGSIKVGDALGVGTKYIMSMSNIEEVYFDDELTKPYGKVVCTCSPSDVGTEMTLEYELVDTDFSSDDYLVYDISSNYYISTYRPTQAEIFDYMITIGDVLRNIRYMPCELTVKGLPFIEAGDWIEFETKDGTMITNVLKQTIRGVQNLMTSIESEG